MWVARAKTVARAGGRKWAGEGYTPKRFSRPTVWGARRSYSRTSAPRAFSGGLPNALSRFGTDPTQASSSPPSPQALPRLVPRRQAAPADGNDGSGLRRSTPARAQADAKCRTSGGVGRTRGLPTCSRGRARGSPHRHAAMTVESGGQGQPTGSHGRAAPCRHRTPPPLLTARQRWRLYTSGACASP